MLMEYLQILEIFSKELREPVAKLIERVENQLRSEFRITRQDFEHLDHTMGDLVQGQHRTGQRFNRPDEIVEDLAQAQ